MIELFTKQERLVILFLLTGLIVGGGIKLLKVNFSNIGPDDLPEYAVQEQALTSKSAEIDSLHNVNKSDESLDEKIYNKSGNSKNSALSIELNSATIDQLISIPNIGPVLANRIIEYRTSKGKFSNIEDIKKVKGIGSKKFNKIKSYIYVNN